MEEYTEHRRQAVFQTWMKRLLVVAVVIVFGGVVYGILKPVRDQASASRVGERLTDAFKVPVKVAETEFRLLPSPRLVLRGVDVGGEFGAEQVALLINWKDLWLALNGGQWVWGEATVAPTAMSAAQAIAAVKRVPGGTAGLPQTISTIRFESIQVSGSRLFPARYEAAMRRGDDGRFGPLVLKELANDDSTMQLQFRPSTGDPGAIDFTLEAQRWAVPVGPRTRWGNVRASGNLRGNVLEVSSYALTGFFGITTGTVFVAGDVEWVVTGTADAGKVDVETVLDSLRGQKQGSSEGRPAAMQGTAALNLVMLGRGATPEDAIVHSAVAGPFTVRFAVLNGINLGLAATQGVAASGVTRFTEFGGTVVASANGVRFEETGGRAGAMVARSNFTVAPDASIAGVVRVELGGQRIQAPMTLRISGTAAPAPLRPLTVSRGTMFHVKQSLREQAPLRILARSRPCFPAPRLPSVLPCQPCCTRSHSTSSLSVVATPEPRPRSPPRGRAAARCCSPTTSRRSGRCPATRRSAGSARVISSRRWMPWVARWRPPRTRRGSSSGS